MPELRLTLLLVGVVFLAGLAFWELRRPRQARGADLERSSRGTAAQPPERGGVPAESAGQDEAREAPLALPHLSAREPMEDLPVIQMPGGALTEPVPAAAPHSTPPGRAGNGRLDPTLDLDADLVLATQTDSILTLEPAQPLLEPPQPLLEPPQLAAAAEVQADSRANATTAWDETAGSASGEGGPEGAAGAAGDELPTARPAAEPIVEWPEPEHSRIVAVRVVAPAERFQGRAVRQALAAQGFVLGKFAIFHKPAPDGRALLSAASLTKPGTFDADSIDMQRFSGLNLFTVLPGPLPAPAAIEELLLCAHTLRERLRGVLQDDRGAPLTASRTTVMRESVSVPP